MGTPRFTPVSTKQYLNLGYDLQALVINGPFPSINQM